MTGPRRLTPINWNEIEDRIRPHVKFLRDAGFDTVASCGHDMWITLACEPADLSAIDTALLAGGYRQFSLSYEIHNPGWRGARLQLNGELAGDGKPFDLVLLKVEPDAMPLYFVVRTKIHPGEERSDDGYFYDEHTCPTNWTGDIVAVIAKGDEDPHGFATFMRRCPAPNGMDEDGDMEGGHEGLLWVDLFPEIGS